MERDYSRWLYYYRVSSAEQSQEGHSLERYREQGTTLGIPDKNIYFDIASGADPSREGFQEVCKRLEDEEGLEGLITPYHSRLHRDEAIWVQIKVLLQSKNLGFIDLGKGTHVIDLSSPEGEFGAGLDALLAQRQRREIQRHSIEGHRNRRKNTRFATAPFGYRVTVQKTLEPNTDEYRPGLTFWKAAQLIVEWLLDENLNLSQVCNRQVEKWGDRNLHRDRPGTPRSLKCWVMNPALRGYFKNTLTGELTDMGHAKLLSQVQYEASMQKFAGPKAPRGKPHPLSGLLFCTNCGKRIGNKKSHGGRYSYMYCLGAHPNPGNMKVCEANSYHPYKQMEDKVIQLLAENAETIGKMAAEPIDEVNPEIEALALQITKLEALNDPDLEEAIDTKKARLNAMRNGEIESYDPEKAQYYAQLASDSRFWAVATSEEKGIVYRELIESGFVSPDGEISLEFNFS